MKLLDVPQVGKRGVTVSQGGRYGLVSRAYVIPTNPRTAHQASVRTNFGDIASHWRTLSQALRDAWIAAALTHQSRPSLGQSGALTGLQLYIRINQVLATFGQDLTDSPPAYPQFQPLAPQNLMITNVSDVITLTLSCPTNPGQNTIVRAAGPVSAGILRTPKCVIIGICPAPNGGAANITNLYVARFGVPTVGTRIFVQCNQYVDGWESPRTAFLHDVPAST